MRPPLDEKQARAKNAYLLKNYNITLEQYNDLRAFQEYRCYICHEHESKFKNGMAVDHRHTEPAITRGLLCWKCNRALGKFDDNAVYLSRAASYINFPPTYVLWGTSPITVPGRVGSKSRNKAIAKLNGTSQPKRRKRGIRRATTKAPGAARRKRTIKI